jgi:hypothetical protein
MRGNTRRFNKWATLPPQLAAIAMAFAPNLGSADQLCGRQFESLAQLYTDLRSEADGGGEASSAWRVLERSTHVTFVYGQMIWTFARESQPSFPAAACLQIVPVEGGIKANVETRCEGAKDACDAVAAKANGKDWSNLFGD